MCCVLYGVANQIAYVAVFIFLFKQKTAYELRISDWSSDVCSSDLAITQLPAPIVASIAFPVALSAMSQIGIKLTTGALFGGNEPINPLMADRPAWLLLLQPLGDLLRTHAMLEPHREMMADRKSTRLNSSH